MEGKTNTFRRRNFIKGLSAGIAGFSISACGKEPQEEEYGQMTTRKNPSTGDNVSILGYGCMRWPSADGRSAREGVGEIDQNAVNELVDYALAHGVNYFDTSPAYCRGKSERATGIALSRHPRKKYFIATKLSNFAPSTWSREASIAMYRNSLKELRTDYIDYMLLHGVGMGNGMSDLKRRYLDNGVLDFLLAERRAGRIRNLGFSYHGDIKVFDYLLSKHGQYKWDFVQIQLNYLDWKHAKQINAFNTNAEYLYGELEKRKIPAVIMEPLLGGRLSAVPHTLVPEFKRREPEKSVASWAFRFAGSFPGVLTVLSGMARPEHLRDNLKTFSPLKPLTSDEFEFLQKTADTMMEFDTIPCNDCKYCMPCPYALDIPSILLHYNKCLNERLVAESTLDPNYAKARRAYLVGYDRSVPKLRQASQCTGCDQCSPHCPQRIDIPKQLRRIDAYVKNLKRGAPLMGDVKKAFGNGKHSLVIANGTITTYDKRGIADLLHLYRTTPSVLKGALVADKAVGKAAASVLVLGGIYELYTPVLSRSALEMLSKARITVSYDRLVPFIENMRKNGMCPMEIACGDAKTPEECLEILTKKFPTRQMQPKPEAKKTP